MKVQVYNWAGSGNQGEKEISSLEDIQLLLKTHEVMFLERDGRYILLLDEKGKKFSTR